MKKAPDIFIVTGDATAGVICAELERMGIAAGWGETPDEQAGFLVYPVVSNADALTASDLSRVFRNLRDDGRPFSRQFHYTMARRLR